MFSPVVMFGVIGKITSSLVIHEELNSITFEGFKLAGKTFQILVNGFFGGFGRGDNLRFATRECHTRLPL